MSLEPMIVSVDNDFVCVVTESVIVRDHSNAAWQGLVGEHTYTQGHQTCPCCGSLGHLTSNRAINPSPRKRQPEEHCFGQHLSSGLQQFEIGRHRPARLSTASPSSADNRRFRRLFWRVRLRRAAYPSRVRLCRAAYPWRSLPVPYSEWHGPRAGFWYLACQRTLCPLFFLLSEIIKQSGTASSRVLLGSPAWKYQETPLRQPDHPDRNQG